MGGKAMALHGVTTERKSTADHLRIEQELIPIISAMFNTQVKGTKFYHTKETHGDCDLLILNHGNLGNVVEKLRERFGIVHNNGNVFSFAYDNYQIDIIPQPTRNWDTASTFFDYDPTGNLMGKIAHKYGIKYGFEGLVYPFRSFSGREVKDIIISKDDRKIFDFLGFDYDRYMKGFDTLEEIYQFIIDSKYFDATNFQMENLNHIDRKRNAKRVTYQGFLKYINTNGITKTYPWKSKEEYIPIINEYFPDAKFCEQLEELKKSDEIRQQAAALFNGDLAMEWTGLKGDELGKCIMEFKKHIVNTYNLDFQTWVIFVGVVNQVQDNFMKFYSIYKLNK